MPIKFPQLPFLTREMLTFGNEAKFEIYVRVYSNSTSTINLVGVTREGLIKFPITHTGDDTLDEFTFGIADIPILLSASVHTIGHQIGTTHVIAYLLINGERVLKFFSGYLSSLTSLSWPIAQSDPELGPYAVIEEFNPSNPAAGAEWFEYADLRRRFKLKYIVATLTTDANAANRRVHLRISSATATDAKRFEVISDTVQTASTAIKYSFAPYGVLPITNSDDDILVNIPADMWIVQSGGIESEVENIQAGDQWSNISVVVEEYLEV